MPATAGSTRGPVGDDEVTVAAVQETPSGDRRRGRFLRECWAELNKVDWPTRPQVIQGTAVVLIACVIVGAFLWGADQALRPFVRDVLIGS